MARILVTGGTGYIGSHTVVELMQSGFEVLIVDNLSNSNIQVLDGIEKIVGRRPDFAQLDVADLPKMRELLEKYTDIVAVIHLHKLNKL